MIRNHARLGKIVHGVPDVIDREVARLKLRSLHVGIDRLTSEQRHYLSSWSEGT
jgi:adenosylhomocysteinase